MYSTLASTPSPTHPPTPGSDAMVHCNLSVPRRKPVRRLQLLQPSSASYSMSSMYVHTLESTLQRTYALSLQGYCLLLGTRLL